MTRRTDDRENDSSGHFAVRTVTIEKFRVKVHLFPFYIFFFFYSCFDRYDLKTLPNTQYAYTITIRKQELNICYAFIGFRRYS